MGTPRPVRVRPGRRTPQPALGQRETTAGETRVKAAAQRLRALRPELSAAPDAVLIQAIELCHRFELSPFAKDVLIYETKETPPRWVVHVSIDVWRRQANKQSLYTYTTRVLSSEELREVRGVDYHPDDIGIELSLYRLDVAREAKELGVPYQPITRVGVWRKQATLYKDVRSGQSQWLADEVPYGRTRMDVAERRAERATLMVAYNLPDPAAPADPETMAWFNGRADNEAARQHVDGCLPAPTPVVRGEDDLIYWSDVS